MVRLSRDKPSQRWLDHVTMWVYWTTTPTVLILPVHVYIYLDCIRIKLDLKAPT